MYAELVDYFRLVCELADISHIKHYNEYSYFTFYWKI